MATNQFIIAIGASAGGVEALTSFFEYTPLDSVSYVIIPHLSADLKSHMAEILSRHSLLEIVEASEGTEVVPNKVYLIPNNKYMEIRNGRLVMYQKEGQSLPHMTIDNFFNSLAEEIGKKAIGVVLSGVGSDGSRGAIAIENAGGVIMVQNPSDAKFDGMPNATLALSETKYIFSAEALPMAIQQYVNEKHEEDLFKKRTLSKTFLAEIINLIKNQFPFDFTDYKLPTLTRRINRRMFYLNLQDERRFLNYLETNPREIEMLISDFLIGVTSFFRDPDAFRILERDVIPQIVQRKSGDEFIKIWVACCSTGEEAYSLAILIKEYLIKNDLELDVKVFATDINQSALDHATKGIFLADIGKTVSKERLQNFFDKVEDSYRIKPMIRKMLIFARHDLTQNPPYVDVDLISCRNMLIYIKPILQQQILAKLAFGLVKEGFLFLGSSENLTIEKKDFREISTQWKIYQSLQSRRHINMESSLVAPLSDPALSNGDGIRESDTSITEPVLIAAMTEVILKESGFCGVSIDPDGQVMEAFGDLSPYLKPERFNFNLRELLPDSLAIAFSASLHKAVKSNQRVRINNIEFIPPNALKSTLADLIISPFKDSKSTKTGLMVLFKSVDSKEDPSEKGEDYDKDIQTREHIKQLQEELLLIKQALSFSNNHLETSKQALHVYNEELLSSNEEIQSANEELQSINEELETVNAEHKYTINELTNLNDDLNNYFRSNTNGQLFVDQDLLLKKFSPGAIKHINVRDRDIGRPLSNITTNIKFETIIGDIKKVLNNGEIIIQEIESNDGKIYQVMTSPYLRKNDQKIDGAIISFYDISELKKTQESLDYTNKMLGLATVAAEMGIWSIDVKTRELTASSRLKDIFGFPVEGQMTFGATLAQVVTEQQPMLLSAIDTAILGGEKLEMEFPVQRLNDGKLRWIKVIGSLTYNMEGKAEALTGIMHDVTDHKLDDIRKNDFISIVSHELKTPLTSMKGYLQVLFSRAQNTEDDFSKTSLQKVNKQVNKMISLVNGFLHVARLETGKIYLNRKTFDMEVLIKEIIDEVLTNTSGYNVVLLPGCNVSINADREKIGQVINNLLNNAIKYSPNGKNIEISCLELSNAVQVNIKDEGIGVKLEDQEKLFDRYFRIESPANTISGFGIGLYLCSEIIQRHNGKIWVESEINKGSTFSFSLPRS